MVVIESFFSFGRQKSSLVALGRWLSYTVTIAWEFASVDSALVVLDEWLSFRGCRLNWFDWTYIKQYWHFQRVTSKNAMHPGFELTDRESRFVIHLDYLGEHFLFLSMKFVNQYLIAHCSLKILLAYCFTLILLSAGKPLYLFTGKIFILIHA